MALFCSADGTALIKAYHSWLKMKSARAAAGSADDLVANYERDPECTPTAERAAETDEYR
jgi:hypothetical protein